MAVGMRMAYADPIAILSDSYFNIRYPHDQPVSTGYQLLFQRPQLHALYSLAPVAIEYPELPPYENAGPTEEKTIKEHAPRSRRERMNFAFQVMAAAHRDFVNNTTTCFEFV